MNQIRNTRVIVWSTVSVIVTSLAGWVAYTGIPAFHSHSVLFVVASLAGAACVLEGHGRVAPDTLNRACLVGAAYGLFVSAAMVLI